MRTFFILLLSLGTTFYSKGEENLRYIDVETPVIETASPSRDDNSTYHFYYSFNWVNDATTYSSNLNPKIQSLEIYKLGAQEPFETIIAPSSSNNQIEFLVQKNQFDNNDQIQYSIKWEISNTLDQRIVHKTNKRTLRINFKTEKALKANISNERIFYTDDINRPRIKLKTTRDGIEVQSLKLHLGPSEASTCVAKVENDVIRINSNIFTELVFTPTNTVPLSEGVTYYLFGRFKDNDTGHTAAYPIPSLENNTFQLIQMQEYYVKPLLNEGLTIKATGNLPVTKIFDTTGDCKEVKASLKLGSFGSREFSLNDKGNNRWELTIPGDTNIPFSTYILEFSGIGKNGRPMKTTKFSYKKDPLIRKIIQLEYNNKVYEATAEFNETPNDNVYLVIDGIDVQMNRSTTNPKSYSVNFAFDDNTLKQLSEKIKAETNNKKRVLITTKVNGVTDDRYTAKEAVVIDIEELEGKNKSEIKEYLEKIGFEENINELAKNISKELKKDSGDRNWDTNVWSSAVEWAPKAISLILMLI